MPTGWPAMPATRPSLTLFCGLPGSGKTTLAKQLAASGTAVRICTDDWQEELGVSHTDDAFHSRLQALLYAHSLVLLRNGLDVILEDGLWTKPERTQKLADAHRLNARTHLHFFDLNLETLQERIGRRNTELPPGAVPIEPDELATWYRTAFERPDESELALFDEVTVHR